MRHTCKMSKNYKNWKRNMENEIYKNVELNLAFEPYKMSYIITVRYFDGKNVNSLKMKVTHYYMQQIPGALRYALDNMIDSLVKEYPDDADFIKTNISILRKQFVYLCEDS